MKVKYHGEGKLIASRRRRSSKGRRISVATLNGCPLYLDRRIKNGVPTSPVQFLFDVGAWESEISIEGRLDNIINVYRMVSETVLDSNILKAYSYDFFMRFISRFAPLRFSGSRRYYICLGITVSFDDHINQLETNCGRTLGYLRSLVAI